MNFSQQTQVQKCIEEFYDEIAHDYHKRGTVDEAVKYLLKEGEKEHQAYLNDLAIDNFQRALERLDTSSQDDSRKDWRFLALKGMGQIYHRIGRNSEAEECFRFAIVHAQVRKAPVDELLKLYFWLGEVAEQQSRYDEMLRLGEEGLTLLGDNTQSIGAALMNILIGVGYGMKGDGNKWREIAAYRNEQFIQRVPYSIELRSAYAVIIQVYAHHDTHSEKFTKWLNALEQKAKQHEDLMGLGLVEQWRGIANFKRGNLHDTISHYQKAQQLFTKAGSPWWCRGWSCDTMGIVLLARGYLQKAEVYIRRALEVYEAIGNKSIMGELYLTLGTILLASSNVQNALEAFHKAVAFHRESKWYGREQWARLALGRAYLARGERLEVLKQFEKSFDFAKTEASFLAEVLSCLEETYEDAEGFRVFCRDFRAENPEVATGPFVRWYLELAEAQNVANIRFQDDFSGRLAAPWMWHDPLGDCSLRVQDGLEIHAVNGRGLKIPHPVNFSAPRLLQAVTGNFTAQVVCTPVLDEKPAIGGLLLWKNPGNFLCLQKGTRGRREISFGGCIGNEDVVVGRGCMPRYARTRSTEPVFLRLERHSNVVNALCSANGVEWFTVGGVAFPIEDPVEVGLHAIGVIDRTIYHGAYPEGTAIRFELFQLWENGTLNRK